MKAISLRQLMALATLVMGGMVATPAAAQVGPCNGIPGQVVVHVDYSTGSPIPLCNYAQQAQQQQQQTYAPPSRPPEPMMQNSNFAAIVFHPDSRQTWIGKDFRRKARAESETLAACNEAMGGGCKPFATVWNTYFVVASEPYGTLLYGYGNSRKAAAADLKKACTANKLNDCTIIQEDMVPAFLDFAGVIDPTRPSLIEPKGDFRRRWAAAAMSEGETPYRPDGDRMWIQGGFLSKVEAEKAVIKACEATTKVKCQIEQTAMDITLFAGLDQKISRRVFIAPSKEGAGKLQRSCDENKDRCQMVVEYPSERADLLVVQLGEEAWRRSKGKIGYQIGPNGEAILPQAPKK